MRNLRIWLCVSILCTTVFIACSPKPKVQVDNLSSITVFYTDVENQTQFVDFDSDSEELATFKTWLKENKNGWENYLATPSVGDITITSQGVSLIVGDDWLIMREGVGTDKVRQLQKSLSTSDIDMFKALR